MMPLALSCGLVTPYGDIYLGNLWLAWWIVVWRHQAITCTKVWSSEMLRGIHLRTLSQEVLMESETCVPILNFQHYYRMSQGPMR